MAVVMEVGADQCTPSVDVLCQTPFKVPALTCVQMTVYAPFLSTATLGSWAADPIRRMDADRRSPIARCRVELVGPDFLTMHIDDDGISSRVDRHRRLEFGQGRIGAHGLRAHPPRRVSARTATACRCRSHLRQPFQ